MSTHAALILEQFTKQASLFQATHRSAEAAIQQALDVSGVRAGDVVLDVACGPGVLTCAFAKRAKHATGIDITPTMLEQAKALAEASELNNVAWLCGDVSHLPFEASSFSLIITRYAFHHFERPEAVLRDMARVCISDGHVVVIDSAPPRAKADRFNEIERRRDPSHTSALTLEEITEIMRASDLEIERQQLYAWEVTADSLLARSFPADGDRDSIRQIYEADVGVDNLGMNARRIDGALYVTFPTLITVARKRRS